MLISRNAFLKIACAVLLGRRVEAGSWPSPFGGASAAGSSGLAGRFRLQDARAALFRQHLRTVFVLRSTEGRRLRLILADVTERPASEHIEQFSLIFHAPTGAAAPDGTSTFQHPVLGAFDLFIVPVDGASSGRTVYEACFSRHVSREGVAALSGDARLARVED